VLTPHQRLETATMLAGGKTRRWRWVWKTRRWRWVST